MFDDNNQMYQDMQNYHHFYVKILSHTIPIPSHPKKPYVEKPLLLIDLFMMKLCLCGNEYTISNIKHKYVVIITIKRGQR